MTDFQARIEKKMSTEEMAQQLEMLQNNDMI